MAPKRIFHPDELSAIREQCDWRRLLDDLGVRADVRRCTAGEFWGYSPFNPDEKTASSHMTKPGVWYDWSSLATAPGRSKPGGGVIELVQAIHAARGETLKLNEAAGWLVECGYSQLRPTASHRSPRPEEDAPVGAAPHNEPIRTDLTPRLSEQGTHPEFVRRGISTATCRYLRCGYLNAPRGTLAGRMVFQIGGATPDGTRRVILSHMGRATTPEQTAKGKWRFYRGFNPSLTLYNLDNLLLDPTAREQVETTGHVLLVEGAFDVAKCVEAGILNVVATFGAHLCAAQADTLRDVLDRLRVGAVRLFYDRDRAGCIAGEEAVARLEELGIATTAFDWEQSFTDREGKPRTIPATIQDPCDLSAAQLRWLRARKVL
ncbi:toprim domain-containing protein [Endothiovibrio diazotrophicus]